MTLINIVIITLQKKITLQQNSHDENWRMFLEKHKSKVEQTERLSIFLARKSQPHKVVNPPKVNF